MIRRPPDGVWCCYCKDEWGKVRIDGTFQWHALAKTPAIYSVISETSKAKGITRSYCRAHSRYITEWHNGELFTLMKQVDLAAGIEVLHV